MEEIIMEESLGKIEISPEVIQVIAGYAVKDIPGVYGLSSSSMIEDMTSWLSRNNFRKGVRVKLGESVEIELLLIVCYGFSLPEIGRQVQQKVKDSVEQMTGLLVEQIKVKIEDVKISAIEKEDKQQLSNSS